MHDWQADFAIFDRDGQLAAIAEAKNKKGANPDWATEWFRNYLGHQQSSAPAFVLLATPETIYVWKRPMAASPEPTAFTDARGLLSPYLPSRLTLGELHAVTFEFIVGAWLDSLSQNLWQPSTPEEIRVFVETGLLEAIQNGRVVADIAA